MAQFIKELGIVDSTLTDKITSYVLANKNKFTTSLLYSSTDEKKFVDKDKRAYKYINNKNFTFYAETFEQYGCSLAQIFCFAGDSRLWFD